MNKIQCAQEQTWLENIEKYVETHEAQFLDEWFSLIRIPSISSEASHQPDMEHCATRLKELLLSSGADRAQVMPSQGNPLVYGEKVMGEQFPTVLVYGHYDVMPVDPVDLWHSNPFEPDVRQGRVYARGADDDKGQFMIQLKAFEYMVKSGQLQCNVKFIFEGEEEIGSPALATFLEEHKQLLRSDVILVSDTSMLAPELPSLTTGLRGLAYWQLEMTGPNRDLHSGHFGGAVANPINELCKLLARVTDEDGRIVVPGFYDDVEPLSVEERTMLASIPFDEDRYKQAIGVQAVQGEVGYSTIERNSCRPSFDICGIWGGYTGEGAKTVLPGKAHAKISCRLVAHQNHAKISQLMEDYLMSQVPGSVTLHVTPLHGGEGYLCPINHPAYQAAEKGFEKAFGKRPLAVRRGGSIPIISDFERILGVKTILMGFGLEENAIHSPNESFSIDMFKKGVIAVTEFYKQLKLDKMP